MDISQKVPVGETTYCTLCWQQQIKWLQLAQEHAVADNTYFDVMRDNIYSID
tara:strand:+ start:302 stop:457 length:156 start_codon:yes stop_codon:yes gene_type:complete